MKRNRYSGRSGSSRCRSSMRIPVGASEDEREFDERAVEETSFDESALAGECPTQAREFELPEPVAFFRPHPVVYSVPEPIAIPRPVPTVRWRPQPVVEGHPQPAAEVHPQPVAEVRNQPIAEVHPQRVFEVQPIAEARPQRVAEPRWEPVAEFRTQAAILKGVEERNEVEPEEESKDSLGTRILRWAWPKLNRRYARRYVIPGLVAYYWTGGTSHQVRDMSATGLYLVTNERWAPGTLIQMTLHKEGESDVSTENSISVMSQLVRWGENGVGFSFIHADNKDVIGSDVLPGDAADRKTVESFLERMEASGL